MAAFQSKQVASLEPTLAHFLHVSSSFAQAEIASFALNRRNRAAHSLGDILGRGVTEDFPKGLDLARCPRLEAVVCLARLVPAPAGVGARGTRGGACVARARGLIVTATGDATAVSASNHFIPP